jgi:hypothetical protein
MKIVIATAVLALIAGAALAQDKPAETGAAASASSASAPVCVAPAAPAQWQPNAIPEKPKLPSCVNPNTRISTCSKTVLDRYNAAVETRDAAIHKMVDDANLYIQTLNHYNLAVTDYNNCEVHRLNGLLQAQNGR